MANFGFSSLSVAAPFAPHWREARSAVGAPDLLEKAKEFRSLSEAVADCTLILGTGTLTHRKPEQPVIALPAVASLIQRELERGGRIALVFGPEKHGLTRDDLSFCHLLVEIPTDPRQPSMNLGQAAAVCLYELATGLVPPVAVEAATAARGKGLPVDSGYLDLLTEVIDEVSVSAEYSPSSVREANRHDLRLLLRRLSLERRDARRILGFFRRIVRRLKP
jgi:tRNA/rRNA methyltransferase